jgi:hypothetical protein
MGLLPTSKPLMLQQTKDPQKKKPLKKVEWQIVGDNLDEDLESKQERIKQPQSTVVYPHLGQPLKPSYLNE